MQYTQSTRLACGWIKKSHNKEISTTGSRARLNICGALSLSDLGNVIVEKYDTVNQTSIIDFLKKIRENSGFEASQSINIILDGASYHKTADVMSKIDLRNFTSP